LRLDNSDNYESNLELVTPTSSKQRDQSIQRTENHLCGSWRDHVQTVLGQRTWLNLPECFHTNENTALDDCEKMSIRKKIFFGFFWFFAFFPKTKRSNLHFLDRKEAT
jgi:hypothetical protein